MTRLTLPLIALMALPAAAQEPAALSVTWPPAGATLPLAADAEGAVGVVVSSNYDLRPAGGCGANARCGHIHMRIDPEGADCDVSADKPYNSLNSDFGGDLIKARFGLCKTPLGHHVIGVLLADDHHKPVLVDGKPVTALVEVTTVAAP